jgi:hypothetical protein
MVYTLASVFSKLFYRPNIVWTRSVLFPEWTQKLILHKNGAFLRDMTPCILIFQHFLDTCRLPVEGREQFSTKRPDASEEYSDCIFILGRWVGSRVGIKAVEKRKCLHNWEMNLSAPVLRTRSIVALHRFDGSINDDDDDIN